MLTLVLRLLSDGSGFSSWPAVALQLILVQSPKFKWNIFAADCHANQGGHVTVSPPKIFWSSPSLSGWNLSPVLDEIFRQGSHSIDAIEIDRMWSLAGGREKKQETDWLKNGTSHSFHLIHSFLSFSFFFFFSNYSDWHRLVVLGSFCCHFRRWPQRLDLWAQNPCVSLPFQQHAPGAAGSLRLPFGLPSIWCLYRRFCWRENKRSSGCWKECLPGRRRENVRGVMIAIAMTHCGARVRWAPFGSFDESHIWLLARK